MAPDPQAQAAAEVAVAKANAAFQAAVASGDQAAVAAAVAQQSAALYQLFLAQQPRPIVPDAPPAVPPASPGWSTTTWLLIGLGTVGVAWWFYKKPKKYRSNRSDFERLKSCQEKLQACRAASSCEAPTI
jgi:hypothetical protein